MKNLITTFRKLMHIHWHREVGTTSQPGPTWTGWSTIWQCRCGHVLHREM
jgi:hypothetical protein